MMEENRFFEKQQSWQIQNLSSRTLLVHLSVMKFSDYLRMLQVFDFLYYDQVNTI